jgi:hypothetical protein
VTDVSPFFSRRSRVRSIACTGWTTKITKNGNRYEKAAYRKGEPLTGKPADSSDAEKVK